MSDETKHEMPEPWVNLEDIAKHLSVSTDTIRAWIRKGVIPHSKAMKQYKFKISEVDEALREGKISDK
jgi:excisionase family DNA binding protein